MKLRELSAAETISVRCPVCRAGAGAPCTMKGGAPRYISTPHLNRRLFASETRVRRLGVERDRTDNLYLESLSHLAAVSEGPDMEAFSRCASLAMDARIDRDIAKLEMEKHQRIL
jgi:hypothetical protein